MSDDLFDGSAPCAKCGGTPTRHFEVEQMSPPGHRWIFDACIACATNVGLNDWKQLVGPTVD